MRAGDVKTVVGEKRLPGGRDVIAAFRERPMIHNTLVQMRLKP
jgi:hypothetical protein